ncbi:NUDIX domain-containing protein [Aestuariimicrobium ganziense]|uniref:NUDIX domain-containing protein n=1 Tax=Aestuariimicrobium ganziense TaxID=2773677 RepID=UPI0019436FB0|nr:NUDIX hydrolase [Aestuariimicrobium ganziense]
MPWQTNSSHVVYENAWIRVRHDEVARPDGSDGVYGVVESRNPAVFIVAIDEDDRVHLVRLDRYTTGEQWEVPAGGTDGEDPLTAAQRELREETGHVARDWQRLGELWALNGVCRARHHVFLARDLHPAEGHEGNQQDEEGISQTRWVPWADVLRMLREGEIQDGETVSALMLAALALDRVS